MQNEIQKIQKRIPALILFFMASLILSGITAFPLNYEVSLLNGFMGTSSAFNFYFPGFSRWVTTVYNGITYTAEHYPYLFYGTDWLAFSHIVIAVAFIGPLRDPVRNKWVIDFGIIACIMVIPLALICGSLRGIPFFWQCIDCSFGTIGIIPLLLIKKYIRQLETVII